LPAKQESDGSGLVLQRQRALLGKRRRRHRDSHARGPPRSDRGDVPKVLSAAKTRDPPEGIADATHRAGRGVRSGEIDRSISSGAVTPNTDAGAMSADNDAGASTPVSERDGCELTATDVNPSWKSRSCGCAIDRDADDYGTP
jgi:hypothetical protein